ncbi:hypothetical protein [Congregibacter sp.]|uniref:hypothetical protein n=1 Tax=Congregibacter sp. TaxID=2744308 RepID=UPI0039E66850
MIGSVTGHLQIQHPKYLEDERMRQTVPNATDWTAKLAASPYVPRALRWLPAQNAPLASEWWASNRPGNRWCHLCRGS